jgi:hypothetical protein
MTKSRNEPRGGSVLGAFLGILLIVCLAYPTAWADSKSKSTLQAVGEATRKQGTTLIHPNGEGPDRNLQQGDPVYVGDTLRTVGDSKILLGLNQSYPEPRDLAIGGESEIAVLPSEARETGSTFLGSVVNGIVRMNVQLPQANPAPDHTIATATALTEVLPSVDPADFVVETDGRTQTTITVIWGKLRVRNVSESFVQERILRSCQRVVVELEQEPSPIVGVSSNELRRLMEKTTIPGTLPAEVPDCSRRSERRSYQPYVKYIPYERSFQSHAQYIPYEEPLYMDPPDPLPPVIVSPPYTPGPWWVGLGWGGSGGSGSGGSGSGGSGSGGSGSGGSGSGGSGSGGSGSGGSGSGKGSNPSDNLTSTGKITNWADKVKDIKKITQKKEPDRHRAPAAPDTHRAPAADKKDKAKQSNASHRKATLRASELSKSQLMKRRNGKESYNRGGHKKHRIDRENRRREMVRASELSKSQLMKRRNGKDSYNRGGHNKRIIDRENRRREMVRAAQPRRSQPIQVRNSRNRLSRGAHMRHAVQRPHRTNGMFRAAEPRRAQMIQGQNGENQFSRAGHAQDWEHRMRRRR